jgi:YesN/AraC family two-component response regulator
MIEADSGESAIVAVEHDSRPIDLLVADLRMPGMDGYQLANALQPRFPGMKVLFLTGFAEALFAHTNVLPAGWAFEEKPTTPRQLRDAVSLLLYGTLSGPGHPPGGDNPAGNLLSY